jgi:hypothetical protein
MPSREVAPNALEFIAAWARPAIEDQNLFVSMNGDTTVRGSRRLRLTSVGIRIATLGVTMVAAVLATPAVSFAALATNAGRSTSHELGNRVVRQDRAKGATRSLPAPKYEGLSICTDASGLKIAQGRTQIVSGISYVTIIFVNAGTSNCYLNGTPFTQPVGATYSPVGPPAAAYFDPSRGDFVILDAGGGTASTSLGIANASKYYPRSSCVLRKMVGVTLRFNYPADFFFRIGTGPTAVCKKITTTSITGVARGVIFGP